MKIQLYLLICFAISIRDSVSCKNGYSIKITNVENCAGPDGIVSLAENTAITVQDDCSLSLEGCVRMKDFNTASGTVTVFKNGKQLFNKSIDLCKPNPKLSFIGDLLPGGMCPQTESETCIDPEKRIKMERFKKMLVLFKGSMRVELNLDHDTGKSCVKIEVEITK